MDKQSSFIETAKLAPETSGFVAPSWGLRDVIPPGTLLAWGARAIYSGRFVDRKVRGKITSTTFEPSIGLVHDRMAWSSHPDFIPPSEAHKALAQWIDSKGFPALQRMCRGQCVMAADSVPLAYTSNGYELRANPRSSYGYLYITVWRIEP